MPLSKNEISFIRSLASAKGRREHGLFVIEGRKSVEEAIASGWNVERIYGTPEFECIEECKIVSDKELERISNLKTPQGVLALVSIPSPRTLPAAESGLILALDGVQDPGNLGTIIRLADWFGIRHIVCTSTTADRFNPKVVQATMGAIFRVEVHYTSDLPHFLALESEAGVPIYGTFLDGENIYSASRELLPNGIIVMGNEGKGISGPVASHVTRRLYIPPYPASEPSSESLNVAIATAIVCSEFRRRG